MRLLLLPLAAAILLAGVCPAHAQQVTHVLPVPASNLIYDPVSRKIYATVGSSNRPELTNSVTAIDPETGQIGTSVFVGSGPGAMTLSAGSKYLYVSVGDGATVRRVDLPGLTAGPQYPLPGKGIRALMPLTGNPDGFVALRGNHARYDDTLGIYVNGQLRGAEASCAPSISQGIAPSRLFTYQNMVSSWDFDGYDVNPQGVRHTMHNQSLMSGYIGLSGSLNGLVVSSGGGMIDPEVRQVVGRLDFKGKAGALLPDPRTGVVLCISEEKGATQTISGCSVRNFQFLGTVTINSGVKGGAGSPIFWGEDGLAYVTDGKVVLVRMSRGTPLPYVDLTVDRSAIPATLPRDNQLKYQLSVTNSGQTNASGVSLSDAFPAEAEVVNVTASQGNATSADGTVRAELGNLAAGARATVDVTLRFREVREVRFTAVVRSFEPDSQAENNINRFAADGPISPLADLTGSWGPLRQVAQGAGINLQAAVVGRFTVRNDGKQASRPVKLRFYACAGPRFDVRVSPLLQEMVVPGLRPGQQYPAVLQALLDPEDDLTGLFIFAVIDADQTLEEASRSNNTVGQRVP